MADGWYLLAWPPVALLAPLACLLLGLGAGIIHPPETYSSSLPILLVMAAIASLGGGPGFWFLLGYAITDFLVFPHVMGALAPLLERAALLNSYAVAGILLMASAPVAGGIRQRLLGAGSGTGLRLVLSLLLAALLQGLLVYVWTQAATILVRPVFTWVGAGPDVDSIAPVQQNGGLLALLAAAVAAARVLVETRAWSQPGMTAVVLRLSLHRARSAARVISIPAPLRVVLSAGFALFLLGGMFDSTATAIVLGVGLLGLAVVHEVLVPAHPEVFGVVTRVPLVIRLLVGFALTGGIAVFVLGGLPDGTQTVNTGISLLPIVVGTLISGLVLMVLVPDRRLERPPPATDGAAH